MVRHLFYLLAPTTLLGIVLWGVYWPPAMWALALAVPLIGVGVHDVLQRKHSLLRNYPVIGHGRYLLEAFRPEIQQYFVESNTDGMPFSREARSVVYQRSKGVNDTVPFGTQRDVYRVGYEWIAHSLAPVTPPHIEPRVHVGGPACKQPYLSSHFNISAMSYGALSKTAVLALNEGARIGGFAQNTGEGGISPHHLHHGGDLIWQIGTGYFGCRAEDGGFDPDRFEKEAARPQVKMIEIKLSQGAKPGHGGILPAGKVTPEISAIRGVPMGKDVISPPAHRAFDTPRGLLRFVQRLRELSGGKPIGIKLCMGVQAEVVALVKAMHATGVAPDFITVDGGEGGTGAAPLEFTSSVGAPLRDGLLFVHNALVGAGLREEITVIASGKIASGFHIMRAIALGADICSSARGMMFALGCIQARRCHENTCPVGVATQDPKLYRGLDPTLKSERVARFHSGTIHAFLELIGAAGLKGPAEIRAHHIQRRTSATECRSLDEVYRFVEPCALLDGTAPAELQEMWQCASPDSFASERTRESGPDRARRYPTRNLRAVTG
ncbi:MAG: FMN-binding glutamate synthase family protein [Myxococcota bacterium]